MMVPYVQYSALLTCNHIGVNLTKNGGPLLERLARRGRGASKLVVC